MPSSPNASWTEPNQTDGNDSLPDGADNLRDVEQGNDTQSGSIRQQADDNPWRLDSNANHHGTPAPHLDGVAPSPLLVDPSIFALPSRDELIGAPWRFANTPLMPWLALAAACNNPCLPYLALAEDHPLALS
ncbi:hypothetical protein CSUB01_10863 [Colletotrichum sublineola]|uniref:Uncharacterized protein n=1 Tax=Colletotrichum sublineola TaxID=1173701 RepID=A0A066WSB1_COLSU|nr:hypothetical protein CSUB01_10863 [Colletotrichum sublineola]